MEEDFQSKREKLTGDWRELHNVKLHEFYSLLSIIRMITSSIKFRAGMWQLWKEEEWINVLGAET
jgi:hypothetical protein